MTRPITSPKYITEASFAAQLKGSTAGQLPNQLKSPTTTTSVQNTTCLNTHHWQPTRFFARDIIGKKAITKMAENRATTPPSLLGTARRMAYTHKKYHSGRMWAGVTRGFAGLKFSGSAKILGISSLTNSIIVTRALTPTRSFQT